MENEILNEEIVTTENQNDPILEVRDLELWFRTDYGKVKILNKLSFDIKESETLGIVGESGCGKSMTSLCIMQLLNCPPAIIKGSIRLKGRELLGLKDKQMQAVRGNQISMIFQEPMTSLNPVFTIGNQLAETFVRHQGMSMKKAMEKAVELLEMVHIPEPAQRVKEFPHQLSGGMRQRVMIAMALACRPELLIADEPTTALDVTIQAQILKLMNDLKREHGTAILFITHDLGVIAQMADDVAVMYCGQVVEKAPARTIFTNAEFSHPYTEGLPKGCKFAPRCKYCTEKCKEEEPQLTEVMPGQQVRCFYARKEERYANLNK